MTMTMPGSAAVRTCSIPLVEVQVEGALDATALHNLDTRITEALLLHPQLLVIDFTRCSALDARAIRVLLDVRTLTSRRGARLVLRNCQPDSVRLLAMAGVLKVFEMDPPPTCSEQGW
jgi:anti-anti-sigma factor